MAKLVHQIWQGDSRELMKRFHAKRQIQSLITDPPWGVNNQSNMAKTPEGKLHARKILGDGSPDEALALFEAVMDATMPGMKDQSDIYIFTSNTVLEEWLAFTREYLPQFGFERKGILYWCKNSPGLGDLDSWGAAIEFILYYKRGKRKIKARRANGFFLDNTIHPGKLIHPHEKPVGLLSKLILHSTDPGDLVVDAFGGSGSLVRAAKATGRHGVAIELDQVNYDKANRALNEAPEELF
jgi:site-specific DNA-methyltransferase (adenine-specific)